MDLPTEAVEAVEGEVVAHLEEVDVEVVEGQEVVSERVLEQREDKRR